MVWLPKWFWMFGFWNGWARRCCWACDTFVFFSKSKQTKYTESFQKRQNDCYFCTVWYFVTLYINAYVLTSFHLSKKEHIVTKEKQSKMPNQNKFPPIYVNTRSTWSSYQDFWRSNFNCSWLPFPKHNKISYSPEVKSWRKTLSTLKRKFLRFLIHGHPTHKLV